MMISLSSVKFLCYFSKFLKIKQNEHFHLMTSETCNEFEFKISFTLHYLFNNGLLDWCSLNSLWLVEGSVEPGTWKSSGWKHF